MAVTWLPRIAAAGGLPSPVTATPFDASHQGDVASIDFLIKQARSYVIGLQFEYDGRTDQRRVLELVGVGAGTPKAPGIPIEIEFKLWRLDSADHQPRLLLADRVTTKGSYAQAFGWTRFKGRFQRIIATINLKPGSYRVEARTLADNPAFVGTPTSLVIDYYADLQFVPHSLSPTNN